PRPAGSAETPPRGRAALGGAGPGRRWPRQRSQSRPAAADSGSPRPSSIPGGRGLTTGLLQPFANVLHYLLVAVRPPLVRIPKALQDAEDGFRFVADVLNRGIVRQPLQGVDYRLLVGHFFRL